MIINRSYLKAYSTVHSDEWLKPFVYSELTFGYFMKFALASSSYSYFYKKDL